MRFVRQCMVLGSVLSATALMMTGCGEPPANNSGGSGGGTGTLRLLVTDKPFPFEFIEEALVTITRIEIRRAGVDDPPAGCASDADCDDGLACNGAESCDTDTGDCRPGDPPTCEDDEVCDDIRGGCASPCTDDAECDDAVFCNGTETCDEASGLCAPGSPLDCPDGEACDEDSQECVEDDGGSPFIVIFEGERVLNLLDLRNGRTDLLADTDVPAGTYTQMRLIVPEGQITIQDVADPFVLRVPSGPQTGIKLHFTFEVVAGEQTSLLLDVDLSRAFKPIPGGRIEEPGDIREFRFSPSLAMRLIDLLDAGSIAGTVTTLDENDDLVPLANASVTAFKGDEEISSTSTEEDGTYMLIGLSAGSYRVEFSATGYDDMEVFDVVVTAGETTSGVDVTLTPTG